MKLLSSAIGATLLAPSLSLLAHSSPTQSCSSESSDPSVTASSSSSTPSSGTSSGSGSGGGSNKGKFSFYYGGGALGACGNPVSDGDFTVALNEAQYGSGSHCFENITITYNGKEHDATITDRCGGCPEGGLDLTPTLFKFFASPDAGVVYGEWSFKNGSSGLSGNSTTGSGSGSGSENNNGDTDDGSEGASSTGTSGASPT